MEKSVEFEVGPYVTHIGCCKYGNATDAQYGGEAQLVVYSKPSDPISRRLFITFVGPGMPVLPPHTQQDDEQGTVVDGAIWMTLDFLPVVLDLVRSGKTLWACIDANDATRNSLYSKVDGGSLGASGRG